jgi:hypothetical protein
MRLFSLIAACAFSIVTLAGGVASAHPKGNGGSNNNNSQKFQNNNNNTQNFQFQKLDKFSKPNFFNGGNSSNNKFTIKNKFKVAPLNKNGKLKLNWTSHKARHHHHHHRLHWCDGDDIDLGDCEIDDSGLEIDELYDDGTASDEGMNCGDVILNINGKAIPDIQTLRDVVGNAGEVIDMVYINGQTGETEAISLYPKNGKIGIYGNTVPVSK